MRYSLWLVHQAYLGPRNARTSELSCCPKWSPPSIPVHSLVPALTRRPAPASCKSGLFNEGKAETNRNELPLPHFVSNTSFEKVGPSVVLRRVIIIEYAKKQKKKKGPGIVQGCSRVTHLPAWGGGDEYALAAHTHQTLMGGVRPPVKVAIMAVCVSHICQRPGFTP